MVTLLQEQRQDSKAEALAGLLEEHAGAEDLVAAVRDEAKRRRIGRMLVERKVDIDAPPRQPRSAVWIWALRRRNSHRRAVLVHRPDVLTLRSRRRGRLGSGAVPAAGLGLKQPAPDQPAPKGLWPSPAWPCHTRSRAVASGPPS